MRVTTGIDIIEVNRIKEAICDMQDSFLNRIYTEEEVKYCKNEKDTQSEMQYQHFAACFATKEAVFKALSQNITRRGDLPWNEIEVCHTIEGRPKINMDRLKKLGLNNLLSIDISMSHIKEYAIASVVAIFND